MSSTPYADSHLWRKIALADCNNFYVSCERAFAPHLHARPMVVLSNNDGCVISRSPEAKSLGIKMGAPAYQYKKFFQDNGVILRSSNYSLYGDMSHRVMTALSHFTERCCVYSIDESFLELHPLHKKTTTEYCLEICRKVHRWTGIPISIGVSTTCTLAKLANRIAKKSKTLQGVFDLSEHPQTDEILRSVPIGDVWGIGRKSTEKLVRHNIQNALELRNAPATTIQQLLTITGRQTQLELQGKACFPMDDTPAHRKSIRTSRSFRQGITTREDLREALVCFGARAAEKARKEHLVAGHLHIYFRTDRHKRQQASHCVKKAIVLQPPTADTSVIIKKVGELANSFFGEGHAYKKAGVTLSELRSTSQQQGDLLQLCQQNATEQKHSATKSAALTSLIDNINGKYGKETVRYASTGVKRPWSMQRQYLSPSFTTNWKDLPRVLIK
ncbi:MAG: Y-family DNA polymerase [Desulfovibrio sp.]